MLSLVGAPHYALERYDATVEAWEILTPPPSLAPQINGPEVVGARPDKVFLFRIPCQGERPMHFEVSGMPDTIVLDAENGILRGRTPTGTASYAMQVKVRNAHGEHQRELELRVGAQIALTPPMGWNTWGGHMLFVSDALIRRAADFLVDKGLADVGFQYVSIDDCWMRIDEEHFEQNRDAFLKRNPGFPYEDYVGPARDEDGNIVPNRFFPDMKALTAYLHARGLKAGIYSSPGPETCQGFAGSYGYEALDAIQYAEWGFDLLKYDMCSYRPIITRLTRALGQDTMQVHEITLWDPMARFLEQQERDILYNLCQYGRQDPWAWAPQIGIQSWRIGTDLNHDVSNYFDVALRIATDLREYSKPGQWNDPDFMFIGKIRDGKNKMAPPKEIPLDSNQRYQFVSLWALIHTPFFFSANLDEMDDFTTSLLTNADIANVNQDALGHVAEVVLEHDNWVVLRKQLRNGDRVLGVFNRDTEKVRTIELTSEMWELETSVAVRDLWRQQELGKVSGTLAVSVSQQGCAVLRFSPLAD
jgi:alpha-galactosidase